MLTTFPCVNFFKEHALLFLFFQSLANCQRPMLQGRMPSWHLPWQKIGKNFRRCPVGHKCAELGCQRHQFCSRTVRAELGNRVDREVKAGHAAAAGVQPRALHGDSAVDCLDCSGRIVLDRSSSVTPLATASQQNIERALPLDEGHNGKTHLICYAGPARVLCWPRIPWWPSDRAGR